jgi:hypothetical protein
MIEATKIKAMQPIMATIALIVMYSQLKATHAGKGIAASIATDVDWPLCATLR